MENEANLHIPSEEVKQKPLLKRWWGMAKERVIALSDDPKGSAIALGIGFFLAVLPGIGISVVLAIGAIFIKKRALALVTGAVLLNPYTIPPFYLASYRIGCKILGIKPMKLKEFMKQFDFQAVPSWHEFAEQMTFFWDHAAPFAVGLAVLGVVVTIALMFISYLLFNAWHGYREQNPSIVGEVNPDSFNTKGD